MGFVNDLISKGFLFPFYEWSSILKEIVLLSDCYSEQIVKIFPYDGVISYLNDKSVYEYSCIAEIFICIECELSTECISFIYKLVAIASEKCFEEESEIEQFEPIIRLIRRTVHNTEIFSLFVSENLLQNIVKMSVSFNVYSVMHEAIVLWCNIISDYEADFCIDFFDEVSFIHQELEEDFNILYLMFLIHSNKWNSLLNGNDFIHKACTDIGIKPFKQRLTALKIIKVYINKSEASDEKIIELDRDYSLYEKISILYDNEDDLIKEEENEEKIMLQLLQTIEKAYENKNNK